MKKHSGFTMIELIIVIAILAVLSVITLPMLSSGFNAYFAERNLSDANWQGRLAISRMLRDIRSMPSTENITTATATQFTFNDSTNTSVSYTLTGTTLERNGFTLANGINSVTFGYYTSAGAVTATIANIRYISIQLNTTENNTNLTMETVVDLRNIIP